MTALAFIDTETTGLSPTAHEVWEFAAVLANHDGDTLTVTDTIHLDITVSLRTSEPGALRIGGYYARRDGSRLPGARLCSPEMAAPEIARATADRHIVAANPAFDVAFLEQLLRRHDQGPAWSYHLIDVSPLVAGYLAARGCDDNVNVAPYRSRELATALGVDVSDDDRHTALGDARWVLRQYATVYGLEVIE